MIYNPHSPQLSANPNTYKKTKEGPNGPVTILPHEQYQPAFIEELLESHKSVQRDHQSFWKQIAKISLPMAMRDIEESGENTRRVDEEHRRDIYNETVAEALDILVAGLSTSMTPSESPWFNTGITVNGKLLTMSAVGPILKSVIEARTEVVRAALYASNFYSTISEVYRDGGMFGNGGVLMDEGMELDGSLDFEYVPLGTFVIMEDFKGTPNGFIRTLSYTIKQLVDAFIRRPDGTYDWAKCSKGIKTHWESGDWYTLVDVVHSILPNYGNKKKPFKIFFHEKGSPEGLFLSEKEKSYFPFYFFRWSKRQGEPYAKDCPGMKTFFTNETLQTLEQGVLYGYNQKADPTLKVSPDVDISLFNRRKHGGAVVVNDPNETTAGLLFDNYMFPFSEVEVKIEKKEMKIKEGFYNNMFLAFLNSTRTEKTREEIIRKYEEKLAMLAPTVVRLKEDLLNPILRDATLIQEQAGTAPTVEQIKDIIKRTENLGAKVANKAKVVPIYTSPLMQAVRSVGGQNLNAFLGLVGSLAQVKANEGSVENPWDWVNMDKLVLNEGEKNYIPAELLNNTEAVDALRNQRRQARQQQAQAQQAQQANLEADTVNTLLKARQGQGVG